MENYKALFAVILLGISIVLLIINLIYNHKKSDESKKNQEQINEKLNTIASIVADTSSNLLLVFNLFDVSRKLDDIELQKLKDKLSHIEKQ